MIHFIFVPQEGFEPSRLSAPDFKPGVTTNSTTGAYFCNYINIFYKIKKPELYFYNSGFKYLIFNLLDYRNRVFVHNIVVDIVHKHKFNNVSELKYFFIINIIY
jgi:hypothetical protein